MSEMPKKAGDIVAKVKINLDILRKSDELRFITPQTITKS